jgi:hypothetical protein
MLEPGRGGGACSEATQGSPEGKVALEHAPTGSAATAAAAVSRRIFGTRRLITESDSLVFRFI